MQVEDATQKSVGEGINSSRVGPGAAAVLVLDWDLLRARKKGRPGVH